MKHSCTVCTGHVSPTFLFHVIELQYKTKFASFRRRDRVILGMKSPKEANISKYTLFNSNIQFYNCQYMFFLAWLQRHAALTEKVELWEGKKGNRLSFFCIFNRFCSESVFPTVHLSCVIMGMYNKKCFYDSP